MDTQNLAGGRGRYAQVLAGIRRPVVPGLSGSDTLDVPEDQRVFTAHLRPVRLVEVESIGGQNRSLIDAARFERKIAHLLRLLASAAFSRGRGAGDRAGLGEGRARAVCTRSLCT